jgi:Uma2 family endonuclease
MTCEAFYCGPCSKTGALTNREFPYNRGSMTATRVRRMRRVEYERLVSIGFFGPEERLELVGGVLVVREPQGSRHATGIRRVETVLRRVFGVGWDVRSQLPVALDDESEPEPDVTVVPGTYDDYRDAHPARPVLIVEIADAGLAFDRTDKASLYARAGIADYWIVNLPEDVLEVYRQPIPTEDASYGWTYGSVRRLILGEFVTPLAAPGARVTVADLLP